MLLFSTSFIFQHFFALITRTSELKNNIFLAHCPTTVYLVFVDMGILFLLLLQGGLQKLLLTTKALIVSSSSFFLDHPVLLISNNKFKW